MPSDLRVVFDTNTLISAFLLPNSILRQAFDSATAARAEFLVTGDDDLLELHTFRGIRIVPPRHFETLFTD